MFLTFFNEANCPKSQTKITCVKRKLYVLSTLSIGIFKQKIHCVKYPRIRVSPTCIFLQKDKIVDSVIIWAYMGQRQAIFSHILHHGLHVN